MTAFCNWWFTKDQYAYKYELKDGMQHEIDERIEDLTAVVESYGMPPVSYVEQAFLTEKTQSLRQVRA